MAFCLSSASLHKMVTNFDTNNNNADDNNAIDCSLTNWHGDDKATSLCLNSLNITMTNMVDSQGYHMLGAFFRENPLNYTHYLPFPGRERMNQKLFFTNVLGRDVRDIGCCSNELIGYHAPFKECGLNDDVWYEMYERFG